MNEIGINALSAIMGITILMGLALYLGFDGVMLMASIGIISGLGGYPVVKKTAELLATTQENIENKILGEE